MEATYWRADRGFYAFATAQPRRSPPIAEPGPNRETPAGAASTRSRNAPLVDEDTVLPAVPMWWRRPRRSRAESEIDHLGSAAMATDWGARLLSNRSALYDPLSYHYGSVWPLFTGWAATGAYRYGRPHVGYQALMANALLTYVGALGYVTELLSGDFATPFGRSSHHQIWSEAMVVAPLVRGLLGIETTDAGGTLRLAPMLPANWDRLTLRGVSAGAVRYDVAVERSPGRMLLRFVRREPGAPAAATPKRLVIAPALPLDARVQRVTVNGTVVKHEAAVVGDVQRVQILTDERPSSTEVVFSYDEGTDAYVEPQDPAAGRRQQRTSPSACACERHRAPPDARRAWRPDVCGRRAHAAPPRDRRRRRRQRGARARIRSCASASTARPGSTCGARSRCRCEGHWRFPDP